MKKLATGLAALIAILALGLLGSAAMQPDVMSFERRKTMQVDAVDVFPHLSDHRLAAVWSPWSAKDPSMTREFSEPSAGQGAWYSWSGNDEVGVAKLTNTKVVDNEEVQQSLVFTAPWQSEARCGFDVKPVGDAVEVTWYYEQDADFGTKMMMVTMDLEEVLGPVYEEGLDSLEQAANASRDERLEAERAAEEAAEPEEAEGP
ncbi:MAG TPA: SRPBCC family protein [Myxococcota bacterium]|nr:SRPBCC family protein [Myxococcota bacterium]